MPANDLTSNGPDLSPSEQLLIQLDPGADSGRVKGLVSALGHVGDLVAHGGPGQGDTYSFVSDGPNQAPTALLSAIAKVPGVHFVEQDYTTFIQDGPAVGGGPAAVPNATAVPTPTASPDPAADPDAATDPDTTTDPAETPDPAAGAGAGSVGDLAVSNDPSVANGQTWGMYGDLTARVNTFGSQAGEAWAANYLSSSKVTVGLIDTGIDYTHPDLYLNIWLNQGEIPTALRAGLKDTDGDGLITFRDLNQAANAAFVTDVNHNGRIDAGDLLHDVRWANGVDEDGNGYTDDLIGWDFVNNDNDPFDDVGHGTHVAGIMDAQGGNGAGVAGVAWNALIVATKTIGPQGGFVSDAVRALDYLTAVSATTNVVATNNSWTASGPSQTLQDAIGRGAQADVLFVAAAGNGGVDQVGDNNDAAPNYPSNYSTTAAAGYDAVIAVASITSGGDLSSFSNYGATSVDLGAPGSAILSTLPGGAYGLLSGTSMATPFVTGAIADYAAANPGATAAQIRADLLASTHPDPALAGKSVTGGLLDVSALIYRTSPAGISITGTTSADTISLTSAPAGAAKATVFDDTITGDAGADKLDGGPGADRLIGGAGNDTYTVDNPGDVVVEQPGDGNDLVNSSISYVLPAEVDRLTLTGAAALTGTGNALANTLTGNGAANLLDGGVGNDKLYGGDGADTLMGGDGNDTLTGGTGADSMVGGAGNDTYDVDSPGDIVTEAAGAGNDLVDSSITYTLPAEVERLILTGSAVINGTGNGAANTLTGNGAANVLDGGAGDDTISGGDGNDTLIGGDGNDKLTGGAGADSLVGGAGNDTYVVVDTSDTIVELPGGGNDLVSSSVTYTLPAEVERLTLTGSDAVNGTGNTLANTLTGNTGDNQLNGGDGNDTISGGLGNDTLDGGAGADKLTGGGGGDHFVFQKGEAAGDVIADFVSGDRIDLHGYGAGSTLTAVAGSTTNWLITDGPSHATELITLTNKYVLLAGDFLFS